MKKASDWRETLAQGAVACRVLQGGAVVEETAPTGIGELWAPIRIFETGGLARGDFAGAYRDFVEGGAQAGRFEGEACETIVKFGAAIQFRQAFTVEFTRKASAARRRSPVAAARRLAKSLFVATLSLLPSASFAETAGAWRLWVFEPDEPGRLERCAQLASAPPGRRIGLDMALTIHWRGGDLVQPGRSDARRDWPAFNACFALVVDDRTVAAGAVVPRQSARLLRAPTLVLRTPPDAERLDFELLPSFPEDPALPTPDAWTRALAPLGRAP